MKYVGIDLHKKTISVCVVVIEQRKRKVIARKRLECQDTAGISSWFKVLGKFEVVVEATYLTWTGDNLLRQVSYQGQREDKPATCGRCRIRLDTRYFFATENRSRLMSVVTAAGLPRFRRACPAASP